MAINRFGRFADQSEMHKYKLTDQYDLQHGQTTRIWQNWGTVYDKTGQWEQAGPDQFDVKTRGFYLITGGVQVIVQGDFYQTIRFYKNGNYFADRYVGMAVKTPYNVCHMSFITEAYAGEWFDMRYYHTGGSTRNTWKIGSEITYQNYFQVLKLS